MGAARSVDLRERVVAEVAAGMSRRQAAARFRVSISSAIRWVELQDQTGSVRPRPRGGKSRSPLEPHAAWLLELVAREGDLTLAELERRILDGIGVKITESSIRRFFARHAITFKKNPARRRAGAAQARERWKAGQGSLDARKLVFVDETGTNTKMVRAYGRCPRGQRLIGKQPWGHWKTTTFTAGLRWDGLVAPWVLDGPMNRDAFITYVEKVLAPTLGEGDLVVMVNEHSASEAAIAEVQPNVK